MHDPNNLGEQDRVWLGKHQPNASDDETERFLERVAIKAADDPKQTIEQIRVDALEKI